MGGDICRRGVLMFSIVVRFDCVCCRFFEQDGE